MPFMNARFALTSCTFTSLLILVFARSTRDPQHTVSPRASTCPEIEGNPDFYGIGIRIGIYLQWFSAWLSNTVNPIGAAANHDANAIFLLAVLIAFTTSLAASSLQPVEAYILLLLSNGFIWTVLSFLGLRLFFLKPSNLETLCRGVSKILQDTAQDVPTLSTPERIRRVVLNMRRDLSMGFSGAGSFLKLLDNVMRELFGKTSLSTASAIKHPALSWAGVVARSAIGSFVAALNIWFWFVPSVRQVSGTQTGVCGQTVFFFGRHTMSGSLLTFFKVVSVAMTVPIAWLLLVCLLFIIQFVVLVNKWLSRQLLISLMEKSRAGQWDELSDDEKRTAGLIISNFTNPQSYATILSALMRDSGIVTLRRILRPQGETPRDSRQPQADIAASSQGVDDAEFWTVKADKIPPLSDLIAGFTSLWNRGTEVEALEGKEQIDVRSSVARLSVFSHVVLLAAIACFIAFVELSISAGNITGVNSINSTGQLIPFIIGIASTAAAARDVIIFYLKNKYTDWHKFSFVLTIGGVGDEMQIVVNDSADHARTQPASSQKDEAT